MGAVMLSQRSKTKTKISQDQLDLMVKRHDRFLRGSGNGSRMDLSFCELKGLNASNVNLRYSEMVGAIVIDSNFSGSNFSNVNMFCANMSGSNLSGCNFEKADARGAKFDCCDLRGSTFENTDCRPGSLVVQDRCGNLEDVFDAQDYSPASFRGAQIQNSNFRYSLLPRASFRGAQVENTTFEHANLVKADFSKATVANTNFFRSNLNGADFSTTDLSKCDTDQDAFLTARMIRSIHEVEPSLRKKIEMHQLWVDSLSKKGQRLIVKGGDLHGLDMSDVNWSAAEFKYVDFQDVILKGAQLSMTMFIKCKLDNADLRDVVARGVKFNGSHMVGVDLSRGMFSPLESIKGNDEWNANFSDTDLSHAIMGGSILDRADFTRSNLSRATLVGAKLPGIILDEAIIDHADFRGADFSMIDIAKASTCFGTKGIKTN